MLEYSCRARGRKPHRDASRFLRFERFPIDEFCAGRWSARCQRNLAERCACECKL
jgi:hypothetical protein